MQDLFDQYDKLPANAMDILTKYSTNDDNYTNCEAMLNELKPLGYTFEYYLDAVPFNIRKI